MSVRVSRGQRDLTRFDEMEWMPRDGGTTLVRARARQMATPPEILALAGVFQASGGQFETFITYETVWEING